MNLREAKAGAESDSTSRIARFRSAVRTAIIVVSGTVGLLVITLMVVGAINANNRAGGSTASPVQTARTQTARQAPHDQCDGNYRPLVIGPSAVLATPGGRNCMIDFDVREGGVILIGLNGEEFGRPVTKDQPAGRSDFRVIEWKSAGTSAKLNVRYYR